MWRVGRNVRISYFEMTQDSKEWPLEGKPLPCALTNSKAKSKKFYLSNHHTEAYSQENVLFRICKMGSIFHPECLISFGDNCMLSKCFQEVNFQPCPLLHMSQQKELLSGDL